MTTNHKQFSENFKSVIKAAMPPKKMKRVITKKIERNLSEIDKLLDVMNIQKSARPRVEMVLNSAIAVAPIIRRHANARKRMITPGTVIVGQPRACDVANEIVRQQNSFFGMNYLTLTKIVNKFFEMNPHYGISVAGRGRPANIDRVSMDPRFQFDY